MRITKIQIKNFRLLKDLSIDIEENLSLVLGKNNCGKTSLLLILDKFLNNKGFTFDDFNNECKEALRIKIEDKEAKDLTPLSAVSISMKIYIEYSANDDLSNIGNKVIMDLDPNNNVVVLGFEYQLSEAKYTLLKDDCLKIKKEKAGKKFDFYLYIKENHKTYFHIAKKSIYFDFSTKSINEGVFTDLIKEKINIDRIINFKWINARRNVSNKDTEKTLSIQSAEIYKKLESKNGNPEAVEKFKDALSNTDTTLNEIYGEIFKEVIFDVKMFGGIKQDDSAIKIISSLQHKDLLEENTTVVYSSELEGHDLPENHNGLGYMNLISMIFQIKILLYEFQKDKNNSPADINLLFIEEPEVHTHPQMQCVFIKNIKKLLENGIVREDKNNKSLQTIISTHSAHIISESDFEDIKYFKKNAEGIISKNIRDLEAEFSTNIQQYKFLKQYLTLNRAELFFTDKVIFIEGDTERILLPAMMKKIDQTDLLNELTTGLPNSLPLFSQNISIIEVGAYSHVFEKFIDFIGMKSLIITDIDSVKDEDQVDNEGAILKNPDGSTKTSPKACLVAEGKNTSNASLKFFYGNPAPIANLQELTTLEFNKKVLGKNLASKTWERKLDGHLLCAFQTKEKNNEDIEYNARSFEDAFFHVSRPFIKDEVTNDGNEFIKENVFESLTNKHLKQFIQTNDPYELAQNGIGSKPSFAMEILLYSKSKDINYINKASGKDDVITLDYFNWNTPSYIEEGLRWLKQE